MHSADHFRREAARFRELAKDCDAGTAASLRALAEDYEAEAEAMEPRPSPTLPPAT